nr:hypothetical protein [Tanacetum cinerariifolium]
MSYNPYQQFEEPHFEEAILTFLRELGHSGEIKMITDVNVNKLYQPWRSFAAAINKCLSGKSTGYDVEHKDAKKSNEMYYPRFTKVIVNFFMTKDQSIPSRNKTLEIPKPTRSTMLLLLELNLPRQACVKKKQVGSDTTMPPPTAQGKRIKTSAKAVKPAKKKQLAKTSKAKGLTVLFEVALTEAKQMKLATKRSLIQTRISHASGSGTDEGTEDDDEDSQGVNVEGDELDEEEANEEDEGNELYRDVNINLEG